MAISPALKVLFIAAVLSCTMSWSQEIRRSKAQGRVLKLEELAYPDIQKLDREKTIFILRFGIMEEHGPHLPIGTDWFHDVAFEDGLITHLQKAHPGYNIVLVAPMPLGVAGANDIVGQFDHPGSFTVRSTTLRAVAVDMGSAIARKGFKNIFVISGHGMPAHNQPLNQASDFVSERYHVRMVDLTTLVEGERDYYVENGKFRERDGNHPAFDDLVYKKRFGVVDPGYYDAHAGINETSMILYCRPDLVRPVYKTLPTFKVKHMADAEMRTDWQGYWGAPALATAEFGKQLIDAEIEQYVKFAEMSLRGKDLSKFPRFLLAPEFDRTTEKEEEIYSTQEKELETWLAAHH